VKAVDPRINPDLVPEGSRATIIAENDDRYQPLPSVRTPNCRVITRWEPSLQERKAIACGEDIFLTILAAGAIQPVLVTVGTEDAVPLWNQPLKQRTAGE